MGFFVSCYEIFLYMTSIGSLLDSNRLQSPMLSDGGPSFHPQHPLQHPHLAASPAFQCHYPKLKGWESCNSASNRSCWLSPPKDSKVPLAPFDINTDYETIYPEGITRHYHLITEDAEIDADGVIKSLGKVFVNETSNTDKLYPGPLIEACWGDEVVIHVTNHMKENGTTIHWHGIRQLNTTEMDGVNGVTQCPIAHGQTFTYKFRLWQYGHTWYHSHYSLQYADGVAAPFLIHGPVSADYDVAFDPIIIADWIHDTSFNVFQQELNFSVPLTNSIVVDGLGHYGCNGSLGKVLADKCTNATTYTTKVVQKGKRYLLRLINGSASTSFRFSIDNHTMQVVSADLVPIKPYKTETVNIGIGQRYGVIVEADQVPGNYWMRTDMLTGCSNMDPFGNSTTTAIWRYEGQDETALPTSTTKNPVPAAGLPCVDEPYASLVPVVPWNVNQNPENLATIDQDIFEATHTNLTGAGANFHGFSRWTLTDTPMWLDFAEPTILNLDNSSFLNDPQISLVDYNYHKGFVYIILAANITKNLDPHRWPDFNASISHPIHLHGHDFAILAAGNNTPYDEAVRNGGIKFKYDNPPRRDVAFLDGQGYLALAFRPDNPGVWLLHCHIAWHASSGLALQILEDKDGIIRSIGALNKTEETCKQWATSDQRAAIDREQNDSGI